MTGDITDAGRAGVPVVGPFDRRLSDKVLVAFHQACAQHDVDVACGLMAVLEHMWRRDVDEPWGRRANVNWLVPARERLLHEIDRADRATNAAKLRAPAMS
jgi:hypothetical protein